MILHFIFFIFRCESTVGLHPSKEWCVDQSHLEAKKSAAHQAAQRGSFQCLRFFLRHSPSCIIKKDGYNSTPGNLAARYRNIDCWKLLITSQFLFNRVDGFKLATYARVMRWCHNAKERALFFKGDSQKMVLLQSTVGRSDRTYLGNKITISGFLDKKSEKTTPQKKNKMFPEIQKKEEEQLQSHKNNLKRCKDNVIFPSSSKETVLSVENSTINSNDFSNSESYPNYKKDDMSKTGHLNDATTFQNKTTILKFNSESAKNKELTQSSKLLSEQQTTRPIVSVGKTILSTCNSSDKISFKRKQKCHFEYDRNKFTYISKKMFEIRTILSQRKLVETI